MASNTALGRHRAEVVKTSSISSLTKAVSSNVGGVGRQAAVIAAASGLVLTSGIAANAATPTVERASDGATTLSLNTELASAITAASTVKISFATPSITSAPAYVEPVVVEAQSNEVVATPATNVAPAAEVAPAAAPTVTTNTPEEAPAPVAKSGIGATIASAALAQLGVAQDCTALASNSLAAAGINFHGWPAGYLSLGRTVSAAEAQPGDLIYYADGGAGLAHIAVYIGNGQAVHGGWNGFTTAVFSANVGSGPVFIAMGH
ncbi:NlpC/P60 family protein [Arthrobacter antibioticus]|uniref:NlpC/P60 family protein n=1 Tax=Arthrobacter sp. H35-MC1 TaxID=3046203 RepID=UPI0024BB86F3|nr:NlpC/P60 family protein [Arthrobacter sp. H35-MC1]MDJ0317429.1 NlpC/P60 family protein [Arthrobacter sp. H35-MC1]